MNYFGSNLPTEPNLPDPNASSLPEVAALVGALCSETITQAECDRLESLLRGNATARSFYLDYMRVHAALQLKSRGGLMTSRSIANLPHASSERCDSAAVPAEGCGLPADATPAPASFPPAELPWPAEGQPQMPGIFDSLFRLHFSFPIVALMLVLIGAAFLSGVFTAPWLGSRGSGATRRAIANEQPNGKIAERQPDSVTQIRPVAYLTLANGCNWGGSSAGVWNVGQSVGMGEEIALQEGIAEFRLSSGVSLNVEGPAVLVMVSPTSLILQQGTLTAHIPWRVADFQILAGTNRLTAADAEFGVQAKGNGVGVHVFSGEVTATLSPYSIKDFTALPGDDFVGDEAIKPASVKIEQSEAVEFTANSDGKTTFRKAAADESRFASRSAMSTRLAITPEYVAAVKRSSPVAYWRFEGIENGHIRNEIAAGCPLRVTADLALPGDQVNRVLELGGAPLAEGNLTSTLPMDSIFNGDFSLELWIKPSHYHRAAVVSAMDKSYAPSNLDKEEYGRRNALCGYGYRLELSPDFGRMPGTLHSVVADPPRMALAESCFTENNLYRVRQWQHVAVVRGRWGMQIFLDGQRVAATQSRHKAALAEGQPLVVGRVRSYEVEIPFIGQMDELAIYDKVLTAPEILEHYQLVSEKPAKGQSASERANAAAVRHDS